VTASVDCVNWAADKLVVGSFSSVQLAAVASRPNVTIAREKCFAVDKVFIGGVGGYLHPVAWLNLLMRELNVNGVDNVTNGRKIFYFTLKGSV
jgi:hypothetical protein